MLLRQAAERGARDLEMLEQSGLYTRLVGAGRLIEHESVDSTWALDPRHCAAVIRPREVDMVSYPYEWCFSQLKAAALLTLDIQDAALSKGMTLKDASAYNVQFEGTKPIFIDTLSITRREEGAAWSGYRQFCQHFLGPLLLMAYVDVRLSELLRVHLDGIPLDLASRLLPLRAKARPGVLAHLVSHARMQQRYADTASVKTAAVRKMSLQSLRGLVDSLRSLVASLDWEPKGTEWVDYYEANNNYAEQGLEQKEAELLKLLEPFPAPRRVWDLGANTGRFSRLLAERTLGVVAWDIDPACVEMHFRMLENSDVENVLPLRCDLTNPSPSLGWAHEERASFLERAKADLALALGLVHHLAIGSNIPFPRIFATLRSVSDNVVVEWVPRGDGQIDRLLSSREDVFEDYDEDGFLAAADPYFRVVDRRRLSLGSRELFLFAGR